MDRKCGLSFLVVLSACFFSPWSVSPAWSKSWMGYLLEDPGNFAVIAVVMGLSFVVIYALGNKFHDFLDLLLGKPTTINKKRITDAVHALGQLLATIIAWWAIIAFSEEIDKLPTMLVAIPLIVFAWISLFGILIPSLCGLSQAITGKRYRVVEKDGRKTVEGLIRQVRTWSDVERRF